MANIVAAFGIAVSAITATAFYVASQREARQARLAQLFAEALLAVSNFQNYPFLVGRRSVGDSRDELVKVGASVHALLDYHADLIRLEAPAVEPYFDSVVEAARREFSPHGRAAWEMRPIEVDSDMNRGLGRLFTAEETTAATKQCVEAMRAVLRNRRPVVAISPVHGSTEP